jgi:hypothetical protein
VCLAAVLSNNLACRAEVRQGGLLAPAPRLAAPKSDEGGSPFANEKLLIAKFPVSLVPFAPLAPFRGHRAPDQIGLDRTKSDQIGPFLLLV